MSILSLRRAVLDSLLPRLPTARRVHWLRPRQDEGWRVLRELRLLAGGEFHATDLVLLDPHHGIAVVVVGWGEFAVPDIAVRVVRAALAERGFAARHRGFLPVVFLAPDSDELEALPEALEQRFAAEPRLGLLDDDWVGDAADCLFAADQRHALAETWNEPPPEGSRPGARHEGRRLALAFAGGALAMALALAAATLVVPHGGARPTDAAASPPAPARLVAAPAAAGEPALLFSEPVPPLPRRKPEPPRLRSAAQPGPMPMTQAAAIDAAPGALPRTRWWPPLPLPPHTADR
jgi:hypothetical protein